MKCEPRNPQVEDALRRERRQQVGSALSSMFNCVQVSVDLAETARAKSSFSCRQHIYGQKIVLSAARSVMLCSSFGTIWNAAEHGSRAWNLLRNVPSCHAGWPWGLQCWLATKGSIWRGSPGRLHHVRQSLFTDHMQNHGRLVFGSFDADGRDRSLF